MCRPSGQACGHEKSPRFAWAVNRSPHVLSHLSKFCKGKSTAFQVNDKKKTLRELNSQKEKNNIKFYITFLRNINFYIIFVVSK